MTQEGLDALLETLCPVKSRDAIKVPKCESKFRQRMQYGLLSGFLIPSYAEKPPVAGFLYTIVCRKVASGKLSV